MSQGDEIHQKRQAKKVLSSLNKLIKKPIKPNISEFYKLLLDENVLDYIDQLLPLVAEIRDNLNLTRIEQVAKWLATESPDRNPVKAAIAILGLFSGDQNKEIFCTLGCHDEFTLYSVVALGNSLVNAESEIWKIAKNVDGWGKIQAVERLTETKNENIKYWMLTDGYKNSIMYAYLAYTCAVTGELLPTLKKAEPDDKLLTSTAEIIEALINGGPVEDINDYSDGAEVIEIFIQHLIDKSLTFEQILSLKSIRDFVDNNEINWSELEKIGWTESTRKRISVNVNSILAKPEWVEISTKALEENVFSDKETYFNIAALVASAVGVDVWDYYYRRQKFAVVDTKLKMGDNWFYLMQTNNPERIDQVIVLAEETIPLEQVATGPAKDLGLGVEYRYHSALDFIVQDLGAFPCKGWNLVKASLKSPVIRNRNLALKALNGWGKENWPEDAKKLLEEAFQNEPDIEVKKSILKVLQGESIL